MAVLMGYETEKSFIQFNTQQIIITKIIHDCLWVKHNIFLLQE